MSSGHKSLKGTGIKCQVKYEENDAKDCRGFQGILGTVEVISYIIIFENESKEPFGLLVRSDRSVHADIHVPMVTIKTSGWMHENITDHMR